MTPAARIAAAIDVLDTINDGTPAEKALTTWARGHRFAGSKDRAAIRDLVFDALRQRASFGVLGDGGTGRALMIGALRAKDEDPRTIFTGEGYAPASLTDAEASYSPGPESDWALADRCDFPSWLEPDLRASLGDHLEPVMKVLKSRAPVDIRVNLSRQTSEMVAASLALASIEAAPVTLAKSALRIKGDVRGLRATDAFEEGLFELQDAASQAVVEALGGPTGAGRALDYCAGGGGKSLALAALGWAVTAHDARNERMADLPARARRAQAQIKTVKTSELSTHDVYDLVVVDAPCSGTGAWRRQPEARWTLTPDMLEKLTGVQADILDHAAKYVQPDGVLAYVTCSLLERENEAQTNAFLARHSGWSRAYEKRWSPLDGGDGFYLAKIVQST
ncbi:MAG: RsmB/NOP family class I SAM-dependent RNA methyltransferase [Pseudomonadota bacterium]